MGIGSVVAVAAAGVLAALPAAAHAGPRFDYKQVFTTDRPGASTGIDTQILYKHPADPNAKPIPVRQEVFTFPVGTRFDPSVVPACTVSDEELRLVGVSACPEETWIGGGHDNVSMTGFPGAGETPISANAFAYGDGRFRVLGQAEGFPLRYIAHGRREGRTNTVEIPRTPGGPPDGESALRRIHNVFPPRSLGRRAYLRTPRTCPSTGVWTFKARLTFADGGVERNVHRMKCRRKRR
ncbi:MAG: hypothetical protein M3340_18255 [Actinomycetota bacterium]|nr:hypothetical protein [Actinomycetota bacterium]